VSVEPAEADVVVVVGVVAVVVGVVGALDVGVVGGVDVGVVDGVVGAVVGGVLDCVGLEDVVVAELVLALWWCVGRSVGVSSPRLARNSQAIRIASATISTTSSTAGHGERCRCSSAPA
jgi:uncharacterized membrane protein